MGNNVITIESSLPFFLRFDERYQLEEMFLDYLIEDGLNRWDDEDVDFEYDYERWIDDLKEIIFNVIKEKIVDSSIVSSFIKDMKLIGRSLSEDYFRCPFDYIDVEYEVDVDKFKEVIKKHENYLMYDSIIVDLTTPVDGYMPFYEVDQFLNIDDLRDNYQLRYVIEALMMYEDNNIKEDINYIIYDEIFDKLWYMNYITKITYGELEFTNDEEFDIYFYAYKNDKLDELEECYEKVLDDYKKQLAYNNDETPKLFEENYITGEITYNT